MVAVVFHCDPMVNRGKIAGDDNGDAKTSFVLVPMRIHQPTNV